MSAALERLLAKTGSESGLLQGVVQHLVECFLRDADYYQQLSETKVQDQ